MLWVGAPSDSDNHSQAIVLGFFEGGLHYRDLCSAPEADAEKFMQRVAMLCTLSIFCAESSLA